METEVIANSLKTKILIVIFRNAHITVQQNYTSHKARDLFLAYDRDGHPEYNDFYPTAMSDR